MRAINQKLGVIINLWTKSGCDVTVHPTQSVGDCRETVKRLACGYDRVVVAGGDGTHNEAVSGLIECGYKKPYGYIPCGSTNDFSHSIGIPVQILPAAENCLSGTPFEYDVGVMNGRHFTYVAGFGAFTEVTYSTPQEQKNLMGYLAYLIAGASSIPNIKPYHVKFFSDEYSGEGDYILGLVTNTLQVGGMKNILPKNISLNDGLFEVLLVKNPRSPIDFNKLLNAVMKRDFSSDCFEYFKTPSVTFESDLPIAWTLDGENGGAHYKTEILCINRALKILVREDLPELRG